MNKKAIRQMFMAFAVFAGAPGPTMSQEQTDALDRASKQLVEPFLQATRKMVEIESPSLDATGIHAMEVELESQAREIGAEIELIPASTGPGNNVVARWRGQGKTNILLVSHMDTVY
ncbi:hypothetical protein N5C66_29435, partial [Rhizobium pusense]|nr:hypothetical protein [Agrobacterium pusense]MDH1099244.1 hypothetical protein [Agrobacterium pusense]MDH1115804.1 hypothetical protein [Agrobacterium pusense]MDH2197563.1 hypothetical protein [Agrobacterium pusense]